MMPQSPHQLAPPPPPLRMVFWETTTACNLACIHCRRLDVPRARSRDDLNTPQALHFIRSLPQTGNPVLIFSGGEPLIRPDLFDLAQEATRLALPIALATNGTIMDHALAQRVAHVGFHRVSISFDGPDPQTHDRFRGIQGAFQSSLRTFAILRQHGLSMQINTALARHNYTKLDQLYQLALHLGADALHVFMLVPVGCGMSLSQDIILTPDEYERALNWIYDRSLEARIQLKATCAPHYFRVMRQRGNPNTRPTPPSDHPHFNSMTKGCLAGQAVCFVSHSGEVFPCGYLPISSGNVKTAPLPEIWRQSPIFTNLRDDSMLQGKCGRCEFANLCMGCRARAFAATGNYLAEEPNCTYTPVRMRQT